MGRGGSSRRLGAGFAVATAFAWALACGADEPGGFVDGGTHGSGGAGGRDVGSPGTGAAPTSGGASSGGSGSGGASSGGTAPTGGTDASSDPTDASSGGAAPDASDDGSTASGGTSSGGTSSGGTAPTGGAPTGGTSSGGTAPTGGAPSGGTDGGDDGPSLPPCVRPRQVLLLGDSYISGNGGFALQPFLSALSPHAAEFRNASQSGAALSSGGIALIPAILDAALRQDPNVDVLIVDGGLSDIVLCDAVTFPGCSPTCSRSGATSVKACTDIASRAILAADALFLQAANAGIENVVFFSYPHIPAQGGGYVDILDFMAVHIRSRCDALDVKTQGRSHCHFVDMVPPFKAGGDLNPSNFQGEPPHPSAAGMTLMAKTLDTFMKNQCLGQPTTSKCCK